MATTPKVLGQLLPSTTALAALYTVPAATKTTVSSIVVTNLTGSTLLFRISIAVAGAIDNNKQYIYYDLPIEANDTFIATIGATLSVGDVIRVKTNSANNLAFTAFGIETT